MSEQEVTITTDLRTLENISWHLGYSSPEEFFDDYGIQVDMTVPYKALKRLIATVGYSAIDDVFEFLGVLNV